MKAALERLVRERAGGSCEYCRLPQVASGVPFEIDHIIARKHDGRTIASNLAISCIYCNAHKGPNISGLDPATGKLTPLFHPRKHRWSAHFALRGGLMFGRTPVGRTTVRVLEMNVPNPVTPEDCRRGMVPRIEPGRRGGRSPSWARHGVCGSGAWSPGRNERCWVRDPRRGRSRIQRLGARHNANLSLSL